MTRRVRPVLLCTLLVCLPGAAPSAQQAASPAASPAVAPVASPAAPSGGLLRAAAGDLRYRMIGPFRGGRTKAASGVPGQPNVFYIGASNGGVWKTTDFGRVWTPIFDDQPTGSIGAIAVAPSSPDVVYVGSGEGLQRPDLSTGDGIYKSTDAGRTWRHLGLRDGQQIPQIAVDPRNPDRLYVAVLGHPYGPNAERGVFRSTDGGRSFERVLYRDENTGGIDVLVDPSNADIVYAALWENRQAPWENGEFTGPGSGLYKSTDGGSTWRQLTLGLPTYAGDRLRRIGLGIAPSRPQRIFATVQADTRGGLYRSDDGGERWSLVNADPYVTERGDDFAEVKVDPGNPDIVYTASVVAWKSVDGGRTFSAFRGAPGGDDYHRVWINPDNPDIVLLASDQGAVITVNGGRTWSSWYNQPTAQLYHAAADNAFPYRVCSGQQESGSVCISSRGDDGRITIREWHPAGVDEYGYAAPDPLDPDIVYGGRVTRYDRRNGEVQNVAPVANPTDPLAYRVIRTQPVLFSPADPKTLYFAANRVWKTGDGGQHWTAISPDLARPAWGAPASVGKYAGTAGAKASQRGVVYALAPSPLDARRIWAGTDDGLIHLTTDGGEHWADVTPAELTPWAKVSIIDASHFDPDTAYAAVNTIRLDDLRPHIYRTRDGGRTWAHVASGIPDGGPVNVVREDPKRRGLLFAGTERAVWVSFDDGDHWESLRLNMPATSVRDLIVKDDDLVVATHGRGFWILDDLAPLRQVTGPIAAARVHLYTPADAWRVQWSKYTDTPMPPDEPSGENPPDGAVIDYFIGAPAAGPVAIEILDAAGKPVRRFSSADPVAPPATTGNWPAYWMRPARVPSATPGMHRFVWDLRYPPPKAFEFFYPISATPGDTAPEPRGPWVVPGAYTVRITAGSVAQTQPLVVKMDPRVKTSRADLERQFALSMRLSEAIGRVHDRIVRLEAGSPQPTARPEEPAPWADSKAPNAVLRRLHEQLLGLYGTVQEVDAAPTPAVVSAAEACLGQVK
jgi:photosystem II stability/assembly factor-like uncharacterized protein